jgi:hypothetical protein
MGVSEVPPSGRVRKARNLQEACEVFAPLKNGGSPTTFIRPTALLISPFVCDSVVVAIQCSLYLAIPLFRDRGHPAFVRYGFLCYTAAIPFVAAFLSPVTKGRKSARGSSVVDGGMGSWLTTLDWA